MRKVFLVTILLITVFLCSCSSSKADDKTSSQPAELSVQVGTFTDADLVFVYEGVSYPLNSDSAPLLAAFGSDYKETKAPSCAYVGEDKMFEYGFATIYTYPLNGKDLIDEIDITKDGYKTNKGIGPGDTLEDVKKQYGDQGFVQDDMYVFVKTGDINDLKSPKLYFEIADNLVTLISYYAASNVQ